MSRSLRWQIQAWHSILLAVIVGGLLIGFYFYEREVKVQLLDKQLWSPIHRLIPFLRNEVRTRNPSLARDAGDALLEDRRRKGPEPRREVMSREEINSFEAAGYYISFWANGESFYLSPNAPSGLSQPEADAAIGELTFSDARSGVWNNGNREVYQALPFDAGMIVGYSAHKIDDEMNRFSVQIFGVWVAVVLLGALGGRWFAGRALRPIKRMSDTAENISIGSLDERIDVTASENELGQLAGVLNRTFDRLEDSFNQQVRFSADASHEMRTPLTVILTKSEFALSRERSPEKYREALTTCYESACHMQGLIESLLELARVDSGQFRVDLKEDDLAVIATDCIAMLQPLAHQKSITIESKCEAAVCQLDLQRMRQVVINLLSNAIKYNSEGGHIKVETRIENGVSLLTVADTGPGIADEDVDHVFDRFYRIDRSRESDEGNTGLGLAISEAIVKAHGGRISVTSKLGHGATFRIEIPVADQI